MNSIGTGIDKIETPALLVDMDILEENISIIESYFKDKKAKLRPHFKTHKCSEIAKMQIKAGAKGITCAKLSEAEVLAAAGIDDILIANQVVESSKIKRLAELACSKRIAVCVDNPENIIDLSHAVKESGATIYVFIEVNIGMNRCGINTKEEALPLASLIQSSPGLVFEGLQGYAGQISHEADFDARVRGVKEAVEKVTGIKNHLEENGIKVNEISGASTGTYNITGDNTIWTEIQAGSYVFMDTDYEKLSLSFKNALSVLATVIHKRPGTAITDAGQKVCCVTKGLPVIKNLPGITALKLNEEHGIINDTEDSLFYLQKIEYIPSHCCSAVNLHDELYGVRNGVIEKIFQIDGRGKYR
ncbi:MAG: DSD1 family PLP-dependent enzyme [Oscillospiraceae bacterium]|nr:DSD1 family PLP-dependent enzyme [Oscillospiraceae bacterium]